MRFRWWRKARLWQLVFTQHDDGSWDPTDASAFAVMASLHPPNERGFARVGLIGAWKVLQTALDVVLSGGEGDITGTGPLIKVTEEDTRGVPPPPVDAPERVDDPLTFHKEAIEWTVPLELRGVVEAHGHEMDLGGAADAHAYGARVWCTLLCMTMLEDHEVCWQTDCDEELTIVDFAHGFLERQLRNNPQLRGVWSAVRQKAAHRLRLWKIVQDDRISAVRWDAMGFKFSLQNMVLRCAAFVGHAVRIRHEFLSAIIGPLLFEGFRKWQRWCLVWTTLLLALVIEVWRVAFTAAAVPLRGPPSLVRPSWAPESPPPGGYPLTDASRTPPLAGFTGTSRRSVRGARRSLLSVLRCFVGPSCAAVPFRALCSRPSALSRAQAARRSATSSPTPTSTPTAPRPTPPPASGPRPPSPPSLHPPGSPPEPAAPSPPHHLTDPAPSSAATLATAGTSPTSSR